MKIATVTLNPAIDQTIHVANFRADTVNRGQETHMNAGGKGINVASFLADYGCSVTATGFLGEENSDIFERLFARKGIEDQCIRIPGQTRISIKIVDEVNQQTTDINLPGQAPPEEAVPQLFQVLEQLAASCDWFVLAGALPPNVPSTIYSTLIEQLKALGKRVVLDTSGEALRAGVRASPTIIKPNVDELQQLIGHPLADEAAIERAARELLGQGIQLVVISMGARGALFVNDTTTLLAVPPRVTVKSTVGAGDALVAGLIAGQTQGRSLDDTARLAIAFSLGAITRVELHLPDAQTLDDYAQRISVQWHLPEVPFFTKQRPT